ncbi:MAG: GRP family sugar transporter [Acidobacteriaceae bacterium]
MLCWGSWANTVKLAPSYRFQLFYWDYVIGLVLCTLALGVSLGSLGSTGRPFFADLHYADSKRILWAVVGGVIFNVANLMLVAAVDVAGLAVAFPVGIGIALVVGSVGSYIMSPKGNPYMLFGGISLVVAAILCDAIAYRERERERRALSTRGVVLSVMFGLLMGSFYPFVDKAMTGAYAPGPYAVSMFFVIGVVLCCVPVNYLFMRKPLDGATPVAMSAYLEAPFRWHSWGILGGVIWCIGAVLNFVASQAHIVGSAVSYSVGQGATMISAAWGVFVWREFFSASKRSKTFLACMFLLFLLGIRSVALGPIVLG